MTLLICFIDIENMNTNNENQLMVLVIKMYDILFILIQNNAKYNGILLLGTNM